MLERNMYDSERYNAESYSQFFPDHRTMRTPVEGTIARDRYEDDPEVATGLLADRSAYVPTIPQGIVQRQGGLAKMLARGQERFGIYCTPCHGLTGDGKGIVACKRDKVTDPCESRGFPPIPSYETPRIRQMPDGQLFATITHGARTMPAYAAQIPAVDRWAIVSYVRALELSQTAEATPTQSEPKK
jgi:mono/diheme cytochrome c family protein